MKNRRPAAPASPSRRSAGSRPPQPKQRTHGGHGGPRGARTVEREEAPPSRPGTPRSAAPRAGEAHRERPLREDLVLQACLEAYGLVTREGRLADRALDFTLRRKANLYSNERRAVAERVYALLRRRRTVDFLLSHARPRFERLDPSRQDVLRLAASRVLHGELADVVARGSSLLQEDAACLAALPDAAAALEALPERERFPIAASLPDFLARAFQDTFGAQAALAAEAMNERAPLTVRVNALKTDRDALQKRLAEEGVTSQPTPLSPFGLILDGRLNAFALPSFKDGLFELQDEGSQLLGMLVDAPPTRVVDACAGAGGKTLQLAAQMKNRGDLHALDIDEKRMDELKKRARRAGVHNVRAQVIPPEAPEADAAVGTLAAKADRVMVDAPCSGTGTFRRKPDARYRLTPEDLTAQVARQRTLIARFATMVKPGGRLVYGTCSVLRAENEDVIAHFLSTHPDFQVRPVAELLGPELAERLGTSGPFLRLAPHLHNTDGFFGAVLVRSKDAPRA